MLPDKVEVVLSLDKHAKRERDLRRSAGRSSGRLHARVKGEVGHGDETTRRRQRAVLLDENGNKQDAALHEEILGERINKERLLPPG